MAAAGEDGMETRAILFDMDGTLLPMDTELFTRMYFKILTAKFAPFGYDPKALIDAVWAGTAAMVKNDGAQTNETVFWARFGELMGEGALRDRALFDEFYREDFNNARTSCGFAPEAKEVIDYCVGRGWRTVVATNPIFPLSAMHARLRWAGLDPAVFERVTSYEDCTFAKPNPDYYREILRGMGLRAEECVMVGNDTDEDMVARSLGMRVFLLTPCLLNRSGQDIAQYPHGDYAALLDFLQALA
jgi:FMN phosphatase YigB (HAD superfamily)